MILLCFCVFEPKAGAWAKARPGQALLLAFGPARRFVKPKPDEARPKPGLSGQAGAGKSLLYYFDQMFTGCDM